MKIIIRSIIERVRTDSLINFFRGKPDKKMLPVNLSINLSISFKPRRVMIFMPEYVGSLWPDELTNCELRDFGETYVSINDCEYQSKYRYM